MQKKRIILSFAIAIAFAIQSPQTTTQDKLCSKEAQKLFGYNPQGTILVSAKEDAPKKILLVLHGFGCPNAEKSYKKYFPGNKKYLPFFFNFKDTLFFNNQNGSLKKTKGALAINIGQTPDAQVALFYLIKAWQKGYIIDIYGHSRGGAVATIITDMLANPDYYINSWKKLEMTKTVPYLFGIMRKTIIDKEKIKKLRKSVEKIYMDKPLMNMQNIISPTVELPLSTATKYKRSEKQPIEILEEHVRNKESFDFHIILAAQDNIVTNHSDNQLKNLCNQAGWEIKTTASEKHNNISTDIRNAVNS